MKHLSLTLPKPCSETWNNFTPTSTGGFCTSCSKTVIDFTKMSDDQIVHFFDNKPAHTCGRFRPDQLKIYLHQAPSNIRPGLTLVKAGVFSLLAVLASKQSSAQTQDTKARSEVVQTPNYRKVESVIAKQEHTVKGVVKAEDYNDHMPGVNIYLKGSEVGTVSDVNGQFEFPVKLHEGNVLVFSFIGYRTKEYVIGKDAPAVLEISMVLDAEIMGEVTVEGMYVTPPSRLRKWWQNVKGVF